MNTRPKIRARESKAACVKIAKQVLKYANDAGWKPYWPAGGEVPAGQVAHEDVQDIANPNTKLAAAAVMRRSLVALCDAVDHYIAKLPEARSNPAPTLSLVGAPEEGTSEPASLPLVGAPTATPQVSPTAVEAQEVQPQGVGGFIASLGLSGSLSGKGSTGKRAGGKHPPRKAMGAAVGALADAAGFTPEAWPVPMGRDQRVNQFGPTLTWWTALTQDQRSNIASLHADVCSALPRGKHAPRGGKRVQDLTSLQIAQRDLAKLHKKAERLRLKRNELLEEIDEQNQIIAQLKGEALAEETGSNLPTGRGELGTTNGNTNFKPAPVADSKRGALQID